MATKSLQELKKARARSDKDKNVITDSDYRMRDKKTLSDSKNTIIMNRDVLQIKPKTIKVKGEK